MGIVKAAQLRCRAKVSHNHPVNFVSEIHKMLDNFISNPFLTHTLGLIPPSCFIFEGCCFADGILYLLVQGFRHQNLKFRIF